MCPSVLELPTLWMTARSLAFNLGLPLTLKGLACKMSKHFHHSFAVPTGTQDLSCVHRNTKDTKASYIKKKGAGVKVGKLYLEPGIL